ncbi:MAG: DUF4349 domain-containing protein [Anaerolineae bacterium]|nr:DUF4349 domain-containing protein [Anaerolineae bacterium]
MIKSLSVFQFGLISVSILAVTIIGLALLGPAVGNIHSSVVNNLDAMPRSTGFVSDGEFAPALGSQVAQPPGQTLPDTNSQPFDQRVILKNASLTLTVETPATRINEIAAMAEVMGGWVVSSNTYTSTTSSGEETMSGTIVVRVPAKRLDEALEQIRSGALKVDNENITGEDVTQEYVDLSSRLENLRASEQQLRTIMDTARKVEDVLAVQRELTTVRGEIEVIQGRLNYFDEASAYSSISVTVYPKAPGPVEIQTIGWNPATTAENALGALVSVLQFLLDAVIVVAIVGVPLALIIGLPSWLIWRTRKRLGFSKPQTRTPQETD